MDLQFMHFKKFNEYKSDIKMLNNDLKRVEQINQNQHSLSSEKLLIGMQEISKNHALLNDPQSILILTGKVRELGWKNIEKLTLDVEHSCEHDDFSKTECLKKIENVEKYVTYSNLSSIHKSEVIRELDFYKYQQNVFSDFQSSFINSFDQNVLVLNQAGDKLNNYQSIKTQNTLVTKNIGVTPVTRKIISQYHLHSQNLAFSCVGIILLLALAISVRARRKQAFIKNFYGRLFRIYKTSGNKVRVFGKLNYEAIKALNSYSSKVGDIFSKNKTFFGEIHFRFKESHEVIKMETTFVAKHSLQTFYEETTGDISTKLKVLISDVENADGEVTFSTCFDGEGEISSSSLNLYLPR